MLIITIALLPIVVVSIFQGVERVQRDVNDVRAQLTQSAHSAAEDYESIFTLRRADHARHGQPVRCAPR